MATQSEFEVPTGTIDGANKTFTTAFPYIAGSLQVWWRGLPRRNDWDDGAVETTPGSGIFDMKEAPLPGDDLQVQYLHTVATLPGVEVSPICGTVATTGDLTGTLTISEDLSGIIECD